MAAGQTNGGNSNGATHGHHQFISGSSYSGHGSSSLPSSVPMNISTSPSSQPQVTANNINTNTSSNSNSIPSSYNSTPGVAANAKPVMNITSPTYYQSNGNVNGSNTNSLATTTTVVAGNSQQNFSQHAGPYQHHHHHHHHYHHNNAQSHHHIQQQQQHQLQAPVHMMVPPEPRPLQMEALRRNDDLLEELQMTVNDLSQWLEVFETGIKNVRTF
ncbi:hypothetical protein EDD21DRAFT_372969 [Dissophora ornata]|nr:hypothetical protein EDD21DRAFT_372969 [Dissophora ornata]